MYQALAHSMPTGRFYRFQSSAFSHAIVDLISLILFRLELEWKMLLQLGTQSRPHKIREKINHKGTHHESRSVSEAFACALTLKYVTATSSESEGSDGTESKRTSENCPVVKRHNGHLGDSQRSSRSSVICMVHPARQLIISPAFTLF